MKIICSRIYISIKNMIKGKLISIELKWCRNLQFQHEDNKFDKYLKLLLTYDVIMIKIRYYNDIVYNDIRDFWIGRKMVVMIFERLKILTNLMSIFEWWLKLNKDIHDYEIDWYNNE
jgi:hypothetical protein